MLYVIPVQKIFPYSVRRVRLRLFQVCLNWRMIAALHVDMTGVRHVKFDQTPWLSQLLIQYVTIYHTNHTAPGIMLVARSYTCTFVNVHWYTAAALVNSKDSSMRTYTAPARISILAWLLGLKTHLHFCTCFLYIAAAILSGMYMHTGAPWTTSIFPWQIRTATSYATYCNVCIAALLFRSRAWATAFALLYALTNTSTVVLPVMNSSYNASAWSSASRLAFASFAMSTSGFSLARAADCRCSLLSNCSFAAAYSDDLKAKTLSWRWSQIHLVHSAMHKFPTPHDSRGTNNGQLTQMKANVIWKEQRVST